MYRNLLVVVFALVLVGCNRSPTQNSDVCKGPDGNTFTCDSNWQHPGAAPTTSPPSMNFTSSDGKVAFVFEKNTPAIPGGSARVGDMGEIWAKVTNTSNQDVIIFLSLVDQADENPLQSGRPSRIFQGGGTFLAGSTQDKVFGFFILADAEPSVPWLRFLAYYGDDYKHGLPPKWYKDIYLGWTINR